VTLNELSPDGLAALGLRNACDREPIHLSGAVQPHGVLLVVDATSHVVTAASRNAARLVGLDPAGGLGGLLGAPLDVVLGAEAAGTLLANHPTGNPHDNLPVRVELPVRAGAGCRPAATRAYDMVAHRRGPLLLVELEEGGDEDAPGTAQLFRRQRTSVKELNLLDDVEGICQLAAVDVRELTGYDRVMIYRFEPDAHGHVIAEARHEDAEAFLGLHYPAGDIPRQARALYLSNWIRLIVDVNYVPVPILAQAGSVPVDQLDLSMSVFRSVSPVHLQYLHNMGVAATMTISLIVDNQLWGLIACHHNSPKALGHVQRLACEALGQQVSVRLKTAESTRNHEHVRDLGRMAAQVVTAMAASENPAAGAAAAASAVLAMTAADGAVVEIDGLRVAMGTVPAAGLIDLLVPHLAGLAGAGLNPLATDVLPRITGLETDSERQAAAAATGTLFLPLPGRVQGFVLWLRGERTQTVRWAGRAEAVTPDGTAVPSTEDQHGLSPRTSFAEWREQVSGRSLPWRARELAVAFELAQAMPEVLLHRAQNRLVRLALHDPLTGLPNRALLQDRLDEQLHPQSSVERTEAPPVALLFVDLDGFKGVNDLQGHAVGDELLRQVAHRLSGIVRPQDTVARMGGDEFVVLLPGTSGLEAAAVAQRVVECFHRSFTLAERVWRSLTCSVGVAVATPGSQPGELLREADAALYHAKRSGRNQVAVYDPTSGTAASRQQLASEELREALSLGQITAHYQPIVDLTVEGAPVLEGFEALARWQHPTRGLLAPDQFIALAEQTGLIDGLGHEVLCQALRQLQAWSDRRLSMAVNVSVQQLVRPGFAEEVLALLVELGIAPHRLCLEITESQMMEHPRLALAALSQLDAADVRIAIDDFGTGFSSLAYVRDLPAAILKIDRMFVAGLPSNPKDVAVVGATVQLAHDLGMCTVAEGVETPEQLAYLRSLGSDFAQGYLLGRPMPADDVPRAVSTDWGPALAGTGGQPV
jgi:diguanylate cyclase (GGDEF)-like protein